MPPLASGALLWSMQVGVREGRTLHLLGCATLVLVFGPTLTLVAGAAVAVLMILAGVHDPLLFGVHGLLLAALPVAVAGRVHRLLRRRLPLHPFVYFLGSGFLGGMLHYGNGYFLQCLEREREPSSSSAGASPGIRATPACVH